MHPRQTPKRINGSNRWTRIGALGFVVMALLCGARSAASDQFTADCRELSQHPHRLTGTDEYLAAAQYVEQRLRDIGVDNVIVQEFAAAQTQVLQCEIELLDGAGNVAATQSLLPMRPNGIMPPITGPDGITGPLYRAGLGRPVDYHNRSPHGCIVVLDYRAGQAWRRAFRLGAKAVIFTPSDDAHAGQTHHAEANANLPRFYYTGSPDGLPDGATATIRSRIVWRSAAGRNVLGVIRGNDPVYRFEKTPELVVVAAALDSFGEVPRQSPGARGAANCAALLRIVEDLVAHDDATKRRNILVAFVDSRARGHAGAAALYRGLDHKKSDLVNRQIYHDEETKFLVQLQELLDRPTPPDEANEDHSTYEELLYRLDQIAIDRVTDLTQRLWKLRKRYLERSEQLSGPSPQLTATAPDVKAEADSQMAALDEQLEALRAEKWLWNDLRRALNKRKLTKRVATVLAAALDQVSANVRARQHELAQIGRNLAADQQLAELLGDSMTVLHVSLMLGDRTNRWGLAVGGRSTLRAARDVAGVYPKVQAAFQDAYTHLSETGRAPADFEVGTVDTALSPADLIWSAPSLTHSGAVAGILGIYNVVLCTVQEDLRREGTPVDTLGRLDLPRMASQAEQIGPLLLRIAEDRALSQASSIEATQSYFHPSFDKGQPAGAMAMAPTQGGSVNSPMPGVTIQVYRAATPKTFQPHKIYAYDDFQIIRTDRNGAYAFGPAHTSPHGYVAEGFGLVLSDDGRVTHVASRKARTTIKERLNLIRCRHGAVVLPPQVVPDQPKTLDGASDSVVSEERSNAAVADGVAYWYCEPRVEKVKLFGLNSVTALANGPARLDPDRTSAAPDEQTSVLEAYRGTGMAVTGPLPTVPTTAQSAADLWRLDESRMDVLRARAIMHSSIEELHGRTEDLLLAAGAADSVARREAQAAGAYLAERAVYTSVRTTMEDLVHAVLVLLALSVPFAFVLERLLIGAVNVYRQIGWFAGIFAATFGLLYLTHPAFSISKNPPIIFLGFAILVLSGLVIFIIMRKFEVELKVLQGMTATVHAADVSRFGTMLAAVAMGVSTMRRRPLRTALTATTIILLTFTILCFASFGAQTGVIRLFLKSPPPYAGVLFHQVNWGPVPESMLDVFDGRWSDEATICPRYWRSSERHDDATAVTRADGTRPVPLKGVLGLSADELPFRDDLTDLLGGPVTDLDQKVFVTEEVAERLGAAVGDRAMLGGIELTIGAILVPARFAMTRDMDDSEILPVDFQDISSQQTKSRPQAESAKEGLGMLRANPNWAVLLPDSVAIVSNANARKLGATLRAVNLYVPDHATAGRITEDMARMLRHPVSATLTDGVYRHLLGAVVQTSNFKELLFPLLLGGLVVFGTMLGSVSDREREIYSFSALGLAPAHVASLFFAEAMVFSIIGGLSGYLLAQATVKGLTLLSAITAIRVPEMNYSSTNAIVTILVVMAMVLVSAIYPAIKASRSANPGVMRTWRLPAPKGDVLDIIFPFTVSQYDFTGILSFLKEHFDNYTDTGLGVFMAQNARFVREGDESLGIGADLALAPFDLGVTQSFELRSAPSEVEGIDEVTIRIERRSGQPKDWQRLNKVLLNDLRRQFLIWRSVSHDAMEVYRQRTLTAITELADQSEAAESES